MKVLALAAAAVLMSGCLAPVKGADRVADADQAKVANCSFVKDVKGNSNGRGGTRAGIGKAMDEAREDAAKAGATNIVWEKITNPDIATVSGKAYRCGG